MRRKGVKERECTIVEKGRRYKRKLKVRRGKRKNEKRRGKVAGLG